MKEALRLNEQRGKTATIFIEITIGSCLLNLSIGFLIAILLMHGGGKTGNFVMENYHKSVYYLTRFTTYLFLVAFISSIVTFIRWLRRAYYNLDVLTKECVYDDSWVAKVWFIPFLNLYRPYGLMKELYEKTDEYLFEQYMLSDTDEVYFERLKAGILKWWWTVNILYVSVFTLELITPSMLFGLMGIGIFGLLKVGLLVLSGVLLISIIKSYQKAEKLIYAINQSV
ncbi:MAG: DUF4328 domain-containing protein [Prevotella sp.]|jgi:hypothetical protein|nr:DUF4328 domain-containing protein [Prevotella sp.]